MKKLKNYNLFLYENSIEMVELFNQIDILESIVTSSDDLLKSINAEEVDLYTTFNINPDSFNKNFNIEFLYNNNNFNISLKKLKLKKGNIETTEETETFIDKTLIVKFFSVYDIDSSELDQPKYIIFQSKYQNKHWEDVKCYKVNDNIKKFYDKLTNKTIEIKKGDKKYVYITSNSGNNWQLQKNDDDQDNITFKEMLSNNEIKAILKEKGVSITIIA